MGFLEGGEGGSAYLIFMGVGIFPRKKSGKHPGKALRANSGTPGFNAAGSPYVLEIEGDLTSRAFPALRPPQYGLDLCLLGSGVVIDKPELVIKSPAVLKAFLIWDSTLVLLPSYLKTMSSQTMQVAGQ